MDKINGELLETKGVRQLRKKTRLQRELDSSPRITQNKVGKK